MLADLHSELDAFLEHEDVEDKVGLQLGPNASQGTEFHQKPLFDGIITGVWRSNSDALHDQLPSYKLPGIDLPIGSFRNEVLMFQIGLSDIENLDIDCKMTPLCSDKNDFPIDAVFFHCQLQLLLEMLTP